MKQLQDKIQSLSDSKEMVDAKHYELRKENIALSERCATLY